MSFSDNCRNCSVMVDNGTGVLVQPNTEDYTYILTAKHNLYHDYENKKCEEPKSLDSIKLVAYDESIKLSIINKYELDDCDIDIAILKIKKVDIFSPKIMVDEVNIGDECFLYGFPKNRKNKKKEEQIRNFELKIVDKTSYIVVENDKYYAQSDIDGCSGGGVFKNINDEAYLIGIEFRMDSVGSKDGNNTRLRFFSIKAFDEIVEKDNNELVYLDEERNFYKKYDVKEDIIKINEKDRIVLKTVPIKIDGKTLNVSIYPVTFEEYDLFCQDIGKKFSFLKGFEEKPVTYVDWNDANQYCKWLGTKIDKKCRLVNSDEWKVILSNNYINIERGIYEWCEDGFENEKKLKIDSKIKSVDLNLKNKKISFRYNILS